MVQNFAVFADRAAAAKIRTAKLWTVHIRIVRMRSDRTKIKSTKISSKGLISNSANFCTSENFPLYGTCIRYYFDNITCIMYMYSYCKTSDDSCENSILATYSRSTICCVCMHVCICIKVLHVGKVPELK